MRNKYVWITIRNVRYLSIPAAFALAEFSLAPFSRLSQVRSYQRGDKSQPATMK